MKRTDIPKRLLLLVASLGLVALAVALPLVYQQRYDRRHAAIFEQMSLGSSRAKLEQLAGEPTYITDGTRWVEPEYERPASQVVPGCATEFWFHSWVTIIPSRWSYCFDDENRLVDKYHWVSW